MPSITRAAIASAGYPSRLVIGAYSAISLRSRAVAGEAHDDDPAGLDAGDDALAEGGVDDVVAEPEATPDGSARRRRRRGPADDRARTGRSPPAPRRAAERAERALAVDAGRAAARPGSGSAAPRLADAEDAAPPRVGQVEVAHRRA